jgi:hypothetical protein
MRLRCELALLLLAGCNQIFGNGPTDLIDAAPLVDEGPDFGDRDRDMIPDPMDSCIQSVWDREADWDGDSYLNKTDGCPFDYESADADADTIYDECDPFASVGGDRQRCVMGFRNPTLNAELWTTRDGTDATWNLLAGIVGNGTGSIVADESFEGPRVTSYEVVSYSSNPTDTSMDGAITVWVRAGTSGSPSDVGCEVTGTSTSSQLAIVGAPDVAPAMVSSPLVRLVRMDATIEPGEATNIRCTAMFLGQTGSTAITVKGHVDLVPGHVAFGVRNATAIFSALEVVERDDAPPL